MTDTQKNQPKHTDNHYQANRKHMRVGHIGDNSYMRDSGIYVEGHIEGLAVDLLLDSGATTTLISTHTLGKIGIGLETLDIHNQTLQAVDGTPLNVHGSLDVQLRVGSFRTTINAVVCDIPSIQGILGQDFISKNIQSWDIQNQKLHTLDGNIIECVSEVKEPSIRRVLVKETVNLLPRTYQMLHVKMKGYAGMPVTSFVEQSEAMNANNCQMVCGIIETNDDDTLICVVNDNDHMVTMEADYHIGQCLPVDDSTCSPGQHVERCAAVLNNGGSDVQTDDVTLPEHLREMFEGSIVHLQPDEKKQFETLLSKYQDVFAKSKDDLGCTNKVKHKINTGNANPIRQPPRRQPYGKREVERTEVEKMLKKGIIEPSNSPWSSPIVLVSKKDGSTRFCVDYRKLNDVTVKDAYPIPRVHDCLDALSESKWFSTMDLCSGFWQVQMDENDKAKTAFSTSQGLYHFTVMPFGLVNAPSTFERVMEDVLRGLQWVESLLYLDDIITPGKSVDQCLSRLGNVFERLRQARLKLKPSKCIFFQKSVAFLGHIVSEHGVQTDPEKVRTVKEWPVPGSSKEVRSFLGLASYYRRFVKGFADIARPLHKLCEKQTKFSWTKDCQEAFDCLKELLTSAPILAYPKLGSQFILDTDASDVGVGAVLSQVQDDKERVITYMSKTMNVHERSYCITRKELLAVITALKHFHNYLYGQKILLRTDNSAVSWMKSLKAPTGQVTRWLQELNTYDMTVEHRAGTSHRNADALSRRPCNPCKHQQEIQEAIEEDDMPCIETVRAVTRSETAAQSSQLRRAEYLLDGWETIDIANSQLSDVEIGIIKVAKESGSKPEWSEISNANAKTKTLWRQWDRLDIIGGLLFRKYEENNGGILNQLVTPSDRRNAVFKFYHDFASGGHLGVEKTLYKIRQAFYWPGMTGSVKGYCSSCDVCAVNKLSRQSNKAPLGQYLVGEPMERVQMDILGPLPVTACNNRYILVIMDWFTKWTECVAIPDMESKTVAKAFLDNFVCRFGTPLQVYTDQGRSFESKLLEDLCEFLGIQKTHATSQRPQANGLVERFNRTLLAMLKSYCQGKQDCWDIYLQQVVMAYRSSPQSSISVTPNKMVLGREIVLPLQAVIGCPNNTEDTTSDSYVGRLKEGIAKCHDIARQSLKVAANYQKKHYDCNAKKRRYHPGQVVWLHDPSRKVGVSTKLAPKWKGPFIITRVIDDLVCKVVHSLRGSPRAYHIDRLYPYKGNNVPSWIKKIQTQLCVH